MTNQLTKIVALNSWNAIITQANTIFDAISNEDMMKEVAPNRSTGVYLLGHLIAVHDRMLPLLGIGEPMYPQLFETYLKNTDLKKYDSTTVIELREYWTAINAKLTAAFDSYDAEEWLQKHTTISDEDFANEPHRNKLSVLLSRMNHLSYHLGQISFLKG